MKLQKWRLLGALTAVVALLAFATVTAYANAPNANPVGMGDENTMTQAAVIFGNDGNVQNTIVSTIDAITLNGYSEGGALAGDCLATATADQENGGLYIAKDTIERGSFNITAISTCALANYCGEALYDVVFHPAADVTMANNFKVDTGMTRVTEGVGDAIFHHTATTTGAFFGAT